MYKFIKKNSGISLSKFLLGFTFIVFVLWATLIEMDEGATARATVISESQKKSIQSIETARITKLHIKEGQYVNKGDILLEIDGLDAKTSQSSSYAKVIQLRTVIALLEEKKKAYIDLSNDGLVSKFDSMTAISEYAKTVAELAAAKDALVNSSSRSENLLIRSPANGQVVGLQANTVGGVVNAGQILMYIAPKEELILEAQISPMDRDVIKQGLPVEISFISLPRKSTPYLKGIVESVADDATPANNSAPSNNQSYFIGRVRVSKDELKRIGSSQILAGMPADILFKTKRRTFFEYLISPMAETLHNAMREE